MANRGLQVAGFYISPDVLFLGSAAVIAVIGTKLMADFNSTSAFTNIAMEGQQVASTTVRIEERIAQIIEKISIYRTASKETRKRLRDQVKAVTAKYRPQIVAALAAFRVKLRAYLAKTITQAEFETAKATLRLQLIDILAAISAETHTTLRVNLQDLKKKIQDLRDQISNIHDQMHTA